MWKWNFTIGGYEHDWFVNLVLNCNHVWHYNDEMNDRTCGICGGRMTKEIR